MTDFEQLYDTYFNDVYLYILRLSGNEHIAEEITSDTFFKAMKSINSFRGDCDVRVWLCQIAKNCYYSYIKKSNRTEQVDEAELQEIPDLAPSVADEYARRDEIERIQKVLHDVNEPYNSILECASEKFDCCNIEVNDELTHLILEMFAEATGFNEELIAQTVDQIIVNEDGKIKLLVKSGVEIKGDI